MRNDPPKQMITLRLVGAEEIEIHQRIKELCSKTTESMNVFLKRAAVKLLQEEENSQVLKKWERNYVLICNPTHQDQTPACEVSLHRKLPPAIIWNQIYPHNKESWADFALQEAENRVRRDRKELKKSNQTMSGVETVAGEPAANQ